MKWFFRFLVLFFILVVTGITMSILRPTSRTVEFEPTPEHLKVIGKHEKQLVKQGGEENLITFELLRSTRVPYSSPIIYPDKLLALDGKQVRMVGFMTPYDDLDILTNFMVMNASVGCNFCAPPEMEEVVFVRQKDKKARYLEGPILVTGTLRLDTDLPARDIMHDTFYYVIDDADVEKLDG